MVQDDSVSGAGGGVGGAAPTPSPSTPYCHDVLYSKFGHYPYRLLTDSVWTQRLCCVVERKGSVRGAFLPHLPAPPPIYSDNSEV